MFTDMVGYTALGQRNESLSLALVEEQRKLIRPILARHNGREVKTIGDAFLVEFTNVLDAVRCAYDIQRAVREFNIPISADRRIHLRVGVHLGDVIESQGDISGDAVNVASRIEPLADDGGVCITRQVYESTHNKFELPMASIGMKSLKNVGEPMEVYKMEMPWSQAVSKEAPSLPRERIAILPFANMSPDPTDDYFADGITDEIITTVAGVSGLSVISRTSVMTYKGAAKRLGEIGRELGVGTILEGSFKKAGNKIRITTQLIDVAGDKHLWAQNYDRNLDDVFEVQSDVAKHVADALRVRILSPEMERINRKPTESTTAYTLYLKGRFLWNKRGIEDLRQARKCFEESIREDPGFALGYVGVADCCIILHNNWALDRKANLENAEVMVAKALELDPSLAEAHATRGLVLSTQYRLSEAEEEFKKSIELKPNYATAHQWYFGLLGNLGRFDEAHAQIEKALELDPLSPIINDNYGDYYFFDMRDYEKALELYKRAVELGMFSAHGYMSLAYGKLKRFGEMRKETAIMTNETKDLYPRGEVADQAYFAWMEGDREKLRRLLPEVEAHLSETGWNNFLLAMPYVYLGDKDKAFELLERAYAENDGTLTGIKVSEFFDGIRTDQRYLDLLKRLGMD